jgi:hypothetical protein
MASQPWVDEVQEQLAKHALPHSYVKRFVEELTDHLEDLKEETMSTEADVFSRLGNPVDVARKTVSEYRQRSFIGRHFMAAFLVFAVSPLVMLLALLTVAFLALLTFFWLIGDDNLHQTSVLLGQFRPIATIILSITLSVSTIIIPSILASFLYCKLARRYGIGKKWMFVSCAILAITASTLIWTVKLSDMPGQSSLTLGSLLTIPTDIQQFIQILAPLAICFWFMRYSRDRNRMQIVS